MAIVGGGISGLAAAYELKKRKRSVAVFERSGRAGGVIQTERVGGFVIDAGPDALLIQKPAAVVLCNELGIADRLVPTKLPRTAYILRGGILHPLPGASILGFPTKIVPMATSRLLSFPGRLRMGLELLLPKGAGRRREDESIAEFVGRRFGSEAVTYIAEPLLAGIHAGDVERLSMTSLFPRLVEAEARSGSVIRFFRSQRTPSNSDGVFRSFPDGLAALVDALAAAVPKESVRLHCPVTRIEKTSGGYVVHADERPAIEAQSVIIAVPGFAAASLLAGIDRELAAVCESIRYLSTATVAFGFRQSAIDHPLRGTGFVVPKTEGINITAGAWVSSKWPQRAPEGHVLLRAFLGGARNPDLLQKSDDELSALALDDLRAILRISGAPALTRVYRWERSTPQQEVGHGALMKKLDGLLAVHPGLFISAAGFRTVGIPDCIADARATAGVAAEHVRR